MFNSTSKIKVSSELYDKLKLAAEIVGSSSLDEYVEGLLSKEVDKILGQAGKKDLSDAEVDEIANKLKGLGYID